MSRGAVFFTLAPIVLIAAACGGSSTDPDPDPDPPAVASVEVTPSDTDLFDGETVQLSATLRSSSGQILTGRTITWSSDATDVAMVNGSGLVTAVGEGPAEVTATSEGQSGSASITVSPQPVATVELDPVGPVDLFTGEMTQFTATTKDGQGNVLTGRAITWSTDPSGVASVDQDGLVTADAEGSTEVTATSEGISGSATVNVAEPGPVSITQVSPGTLVEGQAATITGTGFLPTAALNMVSVDGVSATVTQATATTLDITVPSFACRPERAADVVVAVAGESSPPEGVTVSPDALLSLAVGDQITLTDPSDLCLQFDDAGGAERYLVGVQSVSEVAAALTGVRLTAEAGAGPAAQPLPAPTADARTAGVGPSPLDVDRAVRVAHQRAAEMAFMERSRELLEPIRRANPFRPTPAYRTGPARIPGDVAEGTELTIRFPDFNGNICTDFTDLTVVVRKVSTRAIIVEDVDNPSDGFVAQDFEDITADFDGSIYGTDVDYFGAPTDMDSNERIVIVVTKGVNEFDGPLAFVSGADFFPVATCPASNEGEYYYSRSPDPTGMHGQALTVGDAKLRGRTLLAHEFAHVIQSGRRLAAGGQFMTSPMAEGGATAAEQYSGFQFEGRSEGQNYDNTVIYEAFGADPHTYYGFMGDFVAYFGHDFAGGRNANAPEQCTWVGSVGESPPCSGGRLPYGITFSVLQHAIDLYGAALGGPQAIHRAIVDHTGAPGFAAIEAVFGVTMGELLAHWAPMLYIDDRFGDPSLDEFQFLNWDLRSVEAAWGPGADLLPRARTFGDFSDDVSVRSASTAFFDVSGAGRPATAIRVTDQAGEALPGTFQVFIVRVE